MWGGKLEARLLCYLDESIQNVLLNATALLDTQMGATGSTKMPELCSRSLPPACNPENRQLCAQ